jgi:hypothetical protein
LSLLGGDLNVIETPFDRSPSMLPIDRKQVKANLKSTVAQRHPPSQNPIAKNGATPVRNLGRMNEWIDGWMDGRSG